MSDVFLMIRWGEWVLKRKSTKVSSVQLSRSLVSDSLRPHEPQHARPPCPSSAPGIYPNLCPLSQWCHPTITPLLSPSPPTLNLFQHQGLFKWVSFSHQVAKVLEFQLHISPSNEYSGLISFRIDWLDLLAVQGTLKSLLQHHSSKHQFFSAQLSLQSNSHIHTWLLEKP